MQNFQINKRKKINTLMLNSKEVKERVTEQADKQKTEQTDFKGPALEMHYSIRIEEGCKWEEKVNTNGK